MNYKVKCQNSNTGKEVELPGVFDEQEKEIFLSFINPTCEFIIWNNDPFVNETNYNKVCYRLLQKLLFYDNLIDRDIEDSPHAFLYDKFIYKNPFVKKLVKEVEDEFNYEMSEFQGSWTAIAFLDENYRKRVFEKIGFEILPER